jgi:hypothetical protein
MIGRIAFVFDWVFLVSNILWTSLPKPYKFHNFQVIAAFLARRYRNQLDPQEKAARAIFPQYNYVYWFGDERIWDEKINFSHFMIFLLRGQNIISVSIIDCPNMRHAARIFHELYLKFFPLNIVAIIYAYNAQQG